MTEAVNDDKSARSSYYLVSTRLSWLCAATYAAYAMLQQAVWNARALAALAGFARGATTYGDMLI